MVSLIQAIQPFVTPICFISAWAIVFFIAWSLAVALRDGVANTKQLHRIPCSNCQFFTANYHLKCPVHPSEALSEAAINCPDYDPGTFYGSQID